MTSLTKIVFGSPFYDGRLLKKAMTVLLCHSRETCPRESGERESSNSAMFWTPAGVYPREGGGGSDGTTDSFSNLLILIAPRHIDLALLLPNAQEFLL